MSSLEERYSDCRERAVDALVELLQIADTLGKDQTLVAAEVLAAFQQAAEKALETV